MKLACLLLLLSAGLATGRIHGGHDSVFSSMMEAPLPSHRKLEQKPPDGEWNTLNNSNLRCSSSRPCEQCRGYCSSDSQCRDVLQCDLREGTEPVKGCIGAGKNGRGYCFHPDDDGYLPPLPTPAPTPDPDAFDNTFDCTEQSPCPKCKGECVNDNQCSGSLACHIRSNNEAVSGCPSVNTGAVTGSNYCGKAKAPTPAPTLTMVPTETMKPSAVVRLQLGELIVYDDMPTGGYPVCCGNCEQDSDCAQGLKCFIRSGRQNIPGCSGKGVRAINYCYAESNAYSSPDFAPPAEGSGPQYYFFNDLEKPEACELYAADPNEQVSIPYEGDTGVGGGSTLYGQATYIYLVDQSGSTNDVKVGACGDASGDGTRYDILDCEMLAIEEVNFAAIDGGNVDLVGLVSFSSSGRIRQNLIEPWTKDKPQDRDPKVIHELRKLGSSGVTNFQAGIEKACDVARSSANDNPNTIIIMVSDGKPNRGNTVEDLVKNNCADAIINTYAVTDAADCNAIDENGITDGSQPDTLHEIADFTGGTCTKVVDVTTLPELLVQMEKTTMDSVEVLLNGQTVQTDADMTFDPIRPIFEGPQNTAYSGTLPLGPGNHHVCFSATSSVSGVSSSLENCRDIVILQVDGNPPTQTIDPALQQIGTVSFTVSAAGALPGCNHGDQSVEIEVISGPNSGNPLTTITTDPNGEVTYSVSPPSNPGVDGTDTIRACYRDVHGNDACDTVTVHWVVPSLSPSSGPSAGPTVTSSSFPSSFPSNRPTPSPTPVPTPLPTPVPTPGSLPSGQCSNTPLFGETSSATSCSADPLCLPYRYYDYCSASESFLDLVRARRDLYTTDGGSIFDGGWWYPAIEDKLAAKIFAREENIPTAQLYYCSDDLADIETWVVPPQAAASGFVIKAYGFHSGMGIFVFPNGFDNIEALSGLVMSRSQVRDALVALGAARFVVEEYILGPNGMSVLPDEYRIHVFGRQIGSIIYTTYRGSSCECFSELDEDWNRVDNNGCFRSAGRTDSMIVDDGEGGQQQCTRIDFDEGRRRPQTVKGLNFCSNEPPAPSDLSSILDLARRIGERVGVYMRVDIISDGNGSIYVNEFTPGHTNGRVHCSSRTDENGCVDSCFLGRMWSSNSEDLLHGGSITTTPVGLADWTSAEWSQKCDEHLGSA